MFEVGDKVRYVPNEDSPRGQGASKYESVEGCIGHVVDAASGWITYRYLVSFEGGPLEMPFSEAELVEVA